ncbi:MAG: carbohydrate binding domain-containing protein [Candidatus Bathyarchaeia archaeon]
MKNHTLICCILVSFLILNINYCQAESNNLIKNGGFEDGVVSWFKVTGAEASPSDLNSHSGRTSIRTSNGSLWQVVQVDSPENLKLEFWAYLDSVPGEPSGRTVGAVNVWVKTDTDKKGITYYVFNKNHESQGDIQKKVMLALQRDRWNRIELELFEEFEDLDFSKVQEVNITLWAFRSPEPIVYWDDISLTYAQESREQTQSATTTQTETTQSPEPTIQKPTTTTPIIAQKTLDDQNEIRVGKFLEQYGFFLIIIALIVILAIIVLKKRSRVSKPKPSTKYCISCGSNIIADDEYCPDCGTKQ